MLKELKNKIFEDLKFTSDRCRNELNSTLEFNQAIKEHSLINELYGFMYVDDNKLEEHVKKFSKEKEKEMFAKYCTKIDLMNSSVNYLLEKVDEIVQNKECFEFTELAGFKTRYFIKDDEKVLRQVLKHWLEELHLIVKIELSELPKEFTIEKRGFYLKYEIKDNVLKMTFKK